MTGVEDVLQKILAKSRNLTRERVEALIKERVESYSGFLSEEGALRLIAQDLLIELEDKEGQPERTIPLRDLVPGLNDVNITGRVCIVWPVREFTRPNGEKGTLLKMQVADGTGLANTNVWNPAKELVSELNAAQDRVIGILHARTKKDILGGVELHLDDKTSIDFAPRYIADGQIPRLEDLFTRIKDLKEVNGPVNVNCSMKTPMRISVFEREGRQGSVLRTVIADRSGEAHFVAWNEQVGCLKEASAGDSLQLLNVRVKRGLNNQIEVHAGKNSIIKIAKKPE